jgi:hypothetical protein
MATSKLFRCDCPNCGCEGNMADSPDAYDGEKAMYYCNEKTCPVELYRVKTGLGQVPQSQR